METVFYILFSSGSISIKSDLTCTNFTHLWCKAVGTAAPKVTSGISKTGKKGTATMLGTSKNFVFFFKLLLEHYTLILATKLPFERRIITGSQNFGPNSL
jgi:hypothetical protein